MAVQEIEGVETILFNSIQHDKFGTDVLALTQNQPLLKKQAPQINTISRQKRYNEKWRKIIKSRHPEFNKPSTINLYFLANILQCSCLFIRQYHEIPLFGTEYVLSAIRQRC